VGAELCRIKVSDEKDLAVLEVASDTLALSDRDEFLKACGELLDTGRKHVIIDMRGLRRIFSIFLGTVLDVNVKVGKAGGRLTVMASEEVTKLFRTVAGPEILEVCQTERSGRRKSSRRKSGRTSR